nr:MAG TPA: hypothetical protein [Herelleviridae sp.]
MFVVRQNKYTNFLPYNKGFCTDSQYESLLFTPPARCDSLPLP